MSNPKPNKVVRARTAMIQGQRFYGSLALGLKLAERANVETMATDGTHLFFNPAWVEQAEMPHVIGVTAKLVTQLSLLHHTRRRERDAALWKRAGDLAVNPLVLAAGFELPDGYLVDPTYEDKSAEEIYRLEKAKQPEPQDDQSGGKPGQGGQGAAGGAGAGEQGGEGEEGAGAPESGAEGDDGPGADPGNAGQVLDAINEDGTAPSEAEATQIEMEMATSAVQARNLAKQAGQGTSEMDRLVELLKTAQQDWKEDLRHFILHRAKDDYSFSRPSRRFIGQGLYLPSLHSTRMGEMVVAIDMSGSVGDWVEDFIANLGAIHADVRPSKLHVVYCADKIAGVDTFEPEDDFAPKPRGGGGTSFIPVFDWVAEQGIEPACLVYLTDMEGPAPKDAPDYPVVWAVTTDEKNPWGERIQMRR